MASTSTYANFRITENTYLFQLKVLDGGSGFYNVWLSGQDGEVSINIANVADTTSTALEFNYSLNGFPDPFQYTNDSNYRISSVGDFQLYNVDTAKWHTIAIGGSAGNPTFSINQIGEI